MSVMNIALDGPAGAGKSTAAKAVARALDILYLDTGALYRAVAVAVDRAGVDAGDEAVVAAFLPEVRIAVAYDQGGQVTLLGGEPQSDSLRQPHISQLASLLSSYGCVRALLLQLQRDIAAAQSCVLDGRDIGTHVLPDCPHKFFITATAQARAERRFAEEGDQNGTNSYEQVLAQIIERDERDTNRAHAPLRQAVDAIVVDTTELTPGQTLETILRRIGETV